MDSNERVLLAIGDLKEDIGGLRADVRNLDKRLDGLHSTLKQHIKDDEALASRISKLEHDRTRVKTATAIISTVVSAGFALVVTVAKGLPH